MTDEHRLREPTPELRDLEASGEIAGAADELQAELDRQLAEEAEWSHPAWTQTDA